MEKELLHQITLKIKCDSVKAGRFLDIITLNTAETIVDEVKAINEKIIDLLSFSYSFEKDETRKKEMRKNISFMNSNKDLAMVINRVNIHEESLADFIERLHATILIARGLNHQELRSSVFDYKNKFKEEHITDLIRDKKRYGVSLLYAAYKGRYHQTEAERKNDKTISKIRIDILRMRDMLKFIEKGKIWEASYGYNSYSNTLTFECLAHSDIPIQGYLMDIAPQCFLDIDCTYVPVIKETHKFQVTNLGELVESKPE